MLDISHGRARKRTWNLLISGVMYDYGLRESEDYAKRLKPYIEIYSMHFRGSGDILKFNNRCSYFNSPRIRKCQGLCLFSSRIILKLTSFSHGNK